MAPETFFCRLSQSSFPVPVSPDETKESRFNSLHKWVLSAIAIRKYPGGTQSGPRGYAAPAHLR